MKNYLNQLIQDLKNAEENPVPETDFGNTYEEFEKQMLEIEESRPVDSKNILGISFEELPPADRMTMEQMQDLLAAILNALSAKGTEVTFPGEGVPVKLAYTQLKEHFKEGFYASPGWVIDFCDGWCPDCAFADYCKIKDDTWTQEELKAERNKNNE